MKFKSVVSACALLAASASMAVAAPISLTKTNPSDTFDGGGRKSLRIINDAGPALNQWVTAGGFRLTDQTNGVDFIAWCVDIAHNLSLKGLYEVTSAPFTNTFAFTQTQKDNVKSLFETSYSSLNLNNNNESAGFQLALWEVIYEDSGTFDVKDGSFYSSTNISARNIANGFLANLGGAVTQAYNVSYLESLGWEKSGTTKYSQNLVSVTPVPLPAAGLLLACGLAGLYASNRRKKT